MRSPSLEEEESPEKMCDELTAAAIPCPPCATGRDKVQKIGSEAKPGEREGYGESVFKFGFISHYPPLI